MVSHINRNDWVLSTLSTWRMMAAKGVENGSPSHIHALVFMFYISAFTNAFSWKYIPKYLTFGFIFCIFVVLLLTTDSTDFHRLIIYFHPDGFNSPRSTRSSTEFSISPSCHSERSLRSEESRVHPLRKAALCSRDPSSRCSSGWQLVRNYNY